MRQTWDQTWMAVASVVGQRSQCVRAKVGAAIVTLDNRIVATGYNGAPAGLPVGIDFRGCRNFCERGRKAPEDDVDAGYSDCVAVHAEVNAIAFADRRDYEGGTLYVTSPICLGCAKIVANCGVVRVVYAEDGDRKYRVASRGITFMRTCGLEVVTWES